MDFPKIYFKDSTHEYFSDLGVTKKQSVSGFADLYHDKFSPLMKTYKAIKSLHGSCKCPWEKKTFIDNGVAKERRVQNHKRNCENLLYRAKRIYLWDDPKLIDWVKSKLTPNQLLELDAAAVQWGETWVKEAEYGTEVHLEEETASLGLEYKVNPKDGLKYLVIDKPKYDFCDNYYILPMALAHFKQNIFIPECVVYIEEIDVPGQMDESWFYYTPQCWHATIGDFKTDKKLEMKPFFKAKVFKGKKFAKSFHYPITGLYDNKFFYYTVKMSLYAYALHMMGVKIDHLFLVHKPKKGDVVVYNLNFDLWTIQKMIAHHLNYKLPEYAEPRHRDSRIERFLASGDMSG